MMKSSRVLFAVLTVSFGVLIPSHAVAISPTLSTLNAQNDLPKYGNIAEIKDFHKLYLNTDSTNARKLILKELKKSPDLVVVDSPDDAQYFIEYKVLARVGSPGTLTSYSETSEMTVYVLRDKGKIVAWSETETWNLSKPNEVNLTRHFLKALKKARFQRK